jgi:sulfur carrier protein
MEINLNDKLQQIDAQTTVQALLDKWYGDKQKGIAVAINSTVIPKTNWNDHLLNDKDEVLVIKATQGG